MAFLSLTPDLASLCQPSFFVSPWHTISFVGSANVFDVVLMMISPCGACRPSWSLTFLALNALSPLYTYQVENTLGVHFFIPAGDTLVMSTSVTKIIVLLSLLLIILVHLYPRIVDI